MAGSPFTSQKWQIPDLVEASIASFKDLTSRLEDDPSNASLIKSQLGRFKTWVGCLGAHRTSGSRSIEYRLRDASHIRNYIKKLLWDLCCALDSGVTIAIYGTGPDPDALEDQVVAELTKYFQDAESGETDIDRVLHDVVHIVGCLLRLSTAIANPTPHDHFKSRAKMESLEHYKHWDLKHIQDKYPQVAPELGTKLAAAALQRREYFKYRETHVNKLAAGLDQDADNSEQPTTIASSIPQHLKDADGPGDIPDFQEQRSEISETAYAESAVNSEELRVPPIPKEYLDGPFKCPFCHMIIQLDSMQPRHSWKSHVFGDLTPYVCVELGCSKSPQMYGRRRDWMTHMTKKHWRIWSCPFGCSESFERAEYFREHVQMQHRSQVSKGGLKTIEVLSSSDSPTKMDRKCPLCFAFDIKSVKSYRNHLADHMESLALFTLPRIDAKMVENEDRDKTDHLSDSTFEGENHRADSEIERADRQPETQPGQDLEQIVTSGRTLDFLERREKERSEINARAAAATLHELDDTGYQQPLEVKDSASKVPGTRCPTCAAAGKEVWVIVGSNCRYCGAPCD